MDQSNPLIKLVEEKRLISEAGKFTLHTTPRGSNFPKPVTNNICQVPFKSLNINLKGDCFICDCDAWLPIPVGNILDFARLEDVWTNDIAQAIQKDVTDKNFTYCAVKNCEILQGNIRRNRYAISVGIDESCNLACPSCRRAPVNHTSGPVYDITKQRVDHFVNLLQNFHEPMHIVLCSNGDVLSSAIMRPLVLDWHPKANQTIKLFTNGHLMKKLLPDSTIFPNISEFDISVDAGTAEVYSVVRRPGNFNVLLDNLEWLSDNCKDPNAVELQFCLSSMNYTDIVEFAELCKKFKFRGRIKKIENWNTLDNFSDYNILGNPNSSMYNSAVEQLQIVSSMKHITLSSYIINLLKNNDPR